MNNHAQTQYAGAYQLSGLYVIHSKTVTDVITIISEPYLVLDSKAPLTEIGQAVLQALSESKTGVPFVKTPSSERLRPLLKAAGVNSYKRFVEQAIYCGITRNATSILIDPSDNGGTKGDAKGFNYRPERRIILDSNPAEEQLGRALLQGFHACKTIYEAQRQQ